MATHNAFMDIIISIDAFWMSMIELIIVELRLSVIETYISIITHM